MGGTFLLVCLRQSKVPPQTAPTISQQDYRDIPTPAEMEPRSFQVMVPPVTITGSTKIMP